MQRQTTLLCETQNGRLGSLSNWVAYELKFKDILLLLTHQQLKALKKYLENLNPDLWFKTTDEEFAFVYFAPLCANYYISKNDLAEILQLLMEASAMIKVHERLSINLDKTRVN